MPAPPRQHMTITLHVELLLTVDHDRAVELAETRSWSPLGYLSDRASSAVDQFSEAVAARYANLVLDPVRIGTTHWVTLEGHVLVEDGAVTLDHHTKAEADGS